MSTYKEFAIDLGNGATGEHRLICPKCSHDRRKQHERCLAVNADKKTWICFHCGWTGSLSAETKDKEQKHERPKHVHIDLNEQLLQYMLDRGISRETLAASGICQGHFNQNTLSIKFPYYKSGVVVNAKHRTLDKQFRQERNAEQCLYRYDAIASLDSDRVIITEGEIDALSLVEAGFNDATSVPNGAPAPGAKNYTKEFSYLESAEAIFKHKKRVILAVDNDAPGKVLEQELARRIGVEKCWRVEYPSGCKDLNDVLCKHGQLIVAQTIYNAKPYPVEGIFTSADIHDLIVHQYEHGSQAGTSTGWLKLNPYYTIKTGQLTIITGIPGSGKSNWLDAMMVNLAQHNDWSFAVFSPENWPLQRHAQSILEKWTRKTFVPGNGYSKHLSKQELQAGIEQIADRFYFLMPEESQMTIDSILEKVRVTIFRHGVKGIAIDPWNEIEHDYGNLTETQYISNMLGKIRRFARLNDVHIWIVAHPQKLQKDKDTGKYKPPTMYEISGGAHWRNKADVGICVNRPDGSKDETEIIIQKVRFREVGQLGVVMFGYDRLTGVYTDIYVAGNADKVSDTTKTGEVPF
jgi:twinkle protein